MIVRVVEHLGWLAPGDDASGPAVGCAGRLDGVFAVITARPLRKTAFAVLKDAAVAIVRERSATLDRVERGDSLGREKFRVARSEERRVGKECRTRWTPDH